jgi:hypothetical protein
MSAVSTVDLTFPKKTAYIVTPPSCPRGGWVTGARFTFGDGTTQSARHTMPCKKRKRRP